MGAYFGLLALSGKDAVIVVLCALVHKHLGHGDGAAREVGVVVQSLPHLHQPYVRRHKRAHEGYNPRHREQQPSSPAEEEQC